MHATLIHSVGEIKRLPRDGEQDKEITGVFSLSHEGQKGQKGLLEICFFFFFFKQSALQ